jgi:hypothetical protein
MVQNADNCLAYSLARGGCELGISVIPYLGFLGGWVDTEEANLDTTGIN